ncbi:MAG: sigma-70 family RNA polymerase sigma factor, partial [Flavobacterium sp.]
EIVQNVFIKIWLKREDLSSVDNFGAYLRTISRNETLNALKHIAITYKHEQLIIKHSTELDLDTENTIQYRETKQLLDSAIQKLPAQQKLVYTLCHIEGIKQKDVAERLNISPLTVKVHLREAVKSIRNYLEMHDHIRIVPLLLYLLK